MDRDAQIPPTCYICIYTGAVSLFVTHRRSQNTDRKKKQRRRNVKKTRKEENKEEQELDFLMKNGEMKWVAKTLGKKTLYRNIFEEGTEK
jgi:hypothetical protein